MGRADKNPQYQYYNPRLITPLAITVLITGGPGVAFGYAVAGEKPSFVFNYPATLGTTPRSSLPSSFHYAGQVATKNGA
ncbi:MAG: hypothetical protein ABSB25_06010 [Sedimentisphaerales bacterium]|jgi:hypothetical protein